ncbi:MAG: ParB/RepB/Spo0J family partition protein [Planctomycetaceae bacterium]
MDDMQTQAGEQNQDAPRRRLGRGLSALLGGGGPAYEPSQADTGAELRHIPIARITRNPYQPRKEFDADSLAELAGSIKEHGVLQPVLVRELGDGFQLIAGERRWLAAQKAGLEAMPCCVVDVIDKTACEFALEENLKRKDLSDLEKAQAFRDYITHFECTAEELAKQLSMSRSAVSNLIRLLDLPEPVKSVLQSGKISAGHARALLPLETADQLALCGRIQAEGLNVRQTEQAVKELQGRASPPAEAAPAPVIAADAPQVDNEAQPSETFSIESHLTNHVLDLQHQLRDGLGTAVEIQLKTRDSGSIVIPFAGNEEFERIISLLQERIAAAA